MRRVDISKNEQSVRRKSQAEKKHHPEDFPSLKWRGAVTTLGDKQQDDPKTTEGLQSNSSDLRTRESSSLCGSLQTGPLSRFCPASGPITAGMAPTFNWISRRNGRVEGCTKGPLTSSHLLNSSLLNSFWCLFSLIH